MRDSAGSSPSSQASIAYVGARDAGRWKTLDNTVEQELPDGIKTVRFVPVAAMLTSQAMEDLHVPVARWLTAPIRRLEAPAGSQRREPHRSHEAPHDALLLGSRAADQLLEVDRADPRRRRGSVQLANTVGCRTPAQGVPLDARSSQLDNAAATAAVPRLVCMRSGFSVAGRRSERRLMNDTHQCLR
jgi:hypothetical protein